MKHFPTVSVVLVNYRGVDDTLQAIEGLRELDWPTSSLELVVVDNASGDGSLERIRKEAPDVVLVAQDKNGGFAQGCNAGVRASHGDYVALLNNDARPHAGWISEAVRALELDTTIGCVASKVLTWDGAETDFVEAGMTFYGQAFKMHHDEPDGPQWDTARDVLFASGAALVMPTAVYNQLGGFDERYFMFFEDVDLGWRVWLAGLRVRYVPTSIAYHKHHQSMRKYGAWFEEFLLERNGLYTLYKNLDDANLARFLPPALLLSTRRGMERGGERLGTLDLRQSEQIDLFEHVPASKQALASMHAQDDFLSHLAELDITRRQIQAARRRPDSEIFRLFMKPMIATYSPSRFQEALADVCDVFRIDQSFNGRRRILLHTGDWVGEQMAGPAIRAFQIARALAAEHDVVLASAHPVERQHPDFEITHSDGDDLLARAEWAEIIIFQGFLLHLYPDIVAMNDKVIVADLYDPYHLEQLEARRGEPIDARRHEIHVMVQTLNQQMQRGDFFMCASEKQRDFWLGQLSGLQRVNPLVYDRDESLRSLLAVVPFGVSDHSPARTGPGLRGVVPGIGPDDKVILWGGGIYNWFDPCTLIRSVDRLRERVPEVRLFFMGTRHPNPDVSEHRVAVEAIALAENLGLLDSYVFFNDGWVAYEDRQNFLLDADVGVSTHFAHVETAFSFRTRILDYIWAGLPIVNTEGDSMSTLITDRQIGLTVPPEDVEALADALHRLLTDTDAADTARRNLAEVADEMRWEQTLAPLVDFCRNASRSADAVSVALPSSYPMNGSHGDVRPGGQGWKWAGVRQDLRIIRSVYREAGATALVRQSGRRIRRLTKDGGHV